MYIAVRNLSQEKIRLGLSVSGVALAVMLILFLNGFLTGMNVQITSYLDHTPGSILVAQDGVENLLGATSLLPLNAASRAGAIRGVEQVVPILSRFVILDLHDQKQPAYLIGYLPDEGGGPWEMAEGQIPETDEELVFDQILARKHGIVLGDTIEVMGTDFQVSGLSRGTTSWMTSFIFVRKEAAERLLGAEGATSFLLVTLADAASTQTVQNRLNRLTGIEAVLKTQVKANDRKLFAKIFSIPLQLMVAIAFLIGTLVVGTVIYTATVERQREYGVLKAIGARNGLLYRVVTAQALLAAFLGTGLGVALAYGSGWLIMTLLPQFMVVIPPQAVFQAFGAALVMALAAALFPAFLVAGMAPGEVFRK